MTDITRKRGKTQGPVGMTNAIALDDGATQQAVAQLQAAVSLLQQQIDAIHSTPDAVETVVPEEVHQPELPVLGGGTGGGGTGGGEAWVTAASEADLTALIYSSKLYPPQCGMVTDGVDRGLCYVLAYTPSGGREWSCVTQKTHTSFPQIPTAMLPRKIWRDGIEWQARGGDSAWAPGTIVLTSLTGVPGT